MARMWPAALPSWVLNDPRRAAERKVYARLREDLSDNWVAYYSRPWWGIGKGGAELDGEADFILAHPDHGILFIEVKGGRISHRAESGQWISTDRMGIDHRIKDPMLQAMTCKHEFQRRLSELRDWPRVATRFRHAVIFPDVKAPEAGTESLGGHEVPLFCFGPTLENDFGNWIHGRLAPHVEHPTEQGPGSMGLACLHRLVAEPVRLLTSLRHDLDGELREIEMLLTGAQRLLVAEVLARQRVVVEGGAGTGKTLIATEVAARLAKQDRRVLVMCCSRPLVAHLKVRLASCPNVHVRTIGEFLGSRRGPTQRGVELAVWDTIIVDEAQDVDMNVWASIENATCGRLYVFMDSNQAIYRLASDLALQLGAETKDLFVNLRNTQEIAQVTHGLYSGPLVQAGGPTGKPAEVIPCASNDVIERCAKLLSQLIEGEGLTPSAIAVLVSTESARDRVIQRLMVSGIRGRGAENPAPNAVTVETVALFKGLERPVVVLLADQEIAGNQELAYVAVSRAQVRLFVICGDDKNSITTAIDAARHSGQDDVVSIA